LKGIPYKWDIYDDNLPGRQIVSRTIWVPSGTPRTAVGWVPAGPSAVSCPGNP